MRGASTPRPTVSCVFVSIPNVLANRYASDEMVAIWSPEAKVVAERRLWLAGLRAQAELGVTVPDGVVADYERGIDDVGLASIAARERGTPPRRHGRTHEVHT